MENTTHQFHGISTRRSNIPGRTRHHQKKCQKGRSKFSMGAHEINQKLCSSNIIYDDEEEEDKDDDERVGIERRIMALQRLVPGGESLGIDVLFEETAGYILELQEQVHTMKLLANTFESLEKEKRKSGG